MMDTVQLLTRIGICAYASVPDSDFFQFLGNKMGLDSSESKMRRQL